MAWQDRMKLLVGVDFGTTFSGVAYLQTLKREKDTVIKDWGGAGGEDEKVPTVLSYSGVGYGEVPKFGFEVEDYDEKIEWFKLGLYPHVEETELARRYPINKPKVDDAQCQEYVVGYLTALRRRVDRHLRTHYGEAFWRSTPKEYIITVPAIWPDKSKNITLACAEKAGMGHRASIQIVAEPEAAGIYALQNMKDMNLRRNETFVICDAGGGTVDLVSYTVRALTPIPLVDEAAKGSGALCGSTFLNRVFADYLETKFRDFDPWNRDEEYRADAMKKFEDDIKRKFAGDVDKTYPIRLKGLPDNSVLGIKKGILEIPGRDIRGVFEPVVREILKYVKAQIRATHTSGVRVKAVLLAGGFGRNEYLLKRLKQELGQIDVWKVQESNTAIVRGALIHGLAQKEPRLATFLVGARISRVHYGTRCWLPLADHPQYDPARTRITDDGKGNILVDVMQWFLKKNKPAQEKHPQTFTFCVNQPVDEGLDPANLDIYICKDPQDKGPPDYPGDDAVVSLKLKPDINNWNIPLERLNKELGEGGRWYYQVYFDVEMSLRSASLHFTLIYNGVRSDTVQMEFV